jgi:adenylate cyclase
LERRLAAIMAADVVGYSRLMGEDEAGTLAALKAHRQELIDPEVAAHNGRIVKLMGDGALVEFASVIDAVECAVAIQQGMGGRHGGVPDERRIAFRIGINIGDIIVEGEDIYGDGVNVAARIEGLAEPGGICISRSARDQVRDKLDYALDDLGEHEVKNIARPIRVFRVLTDGEGAETAVAAIGKGRKPWRWAAAAGAMIAIVGGLAIWQLGPPAPAPVEALAPEVISDPAPTPVQLPDKPSIAVLPFTNMSGDPEQEYFSDGITEDITTALSKMSGLFVVARNSSFTYKGKAVKVRDVGRDLGVRHVLEGSVRKSGGRVRITAQLIDATTGDHVWAERYDRELTDVFAVQDDVTQEIVSVLAVKLSAEDEARLRRVVQVDPDAYDMLLRGLALQRRYTQETNVESREFFMKAIAIDPGYARAHANIGYSLSLDVLNGWPEDREATLHKAEAHIETAIRLDPALPQVHFAASSLYRIRRQLDQALVAIQKAIELEPNYAEGYGSMAMVLIYAGRPDEGLEAVRTSMRLNPFNSFFIYWVLGQCYFHLERYDEAAVQFERATEANPQFLRGHLLLAATYGQLGRIDDAEWEAQEALTLLPGLTLRQRRAIVPYKKQADVERYIDGLRKAGIPE